MNGECPHGMGFIEILNAIEEQYKREKETGVREWGYLCSCCMAPSGDLRTCPSCSLVEVKA